LKEIGPDDDRVDVWMAWLLPELKAKAETAPRDATRMVRLNFMMKCINNNKMQYMMYL
jgi:hypothetical protein